MKAFYVGIIDKENKIHFITEIDIKSKSAYWENGKKAHQFSTLNLANSICYGLRCNGYKSITMIMPDYEEPENIEF